MVPSKAELSGLEFLVLIIVSLMSCLSNRIKTEITRRNREKLTEFQFRLICLLGVLAYLERLSDLQKEVLRLNMAGYLPGEVREELQISTKQYDDCYAAIRSYRNVQLIFVNE